MCSSCGKPSSFTTITYGLTGSTSTVQSCKYTKTQLENALAFYSQDPQSNWIALSYIRSALNFYAKDCNRYNLFLDGLQMDL